MLININEIKVSSDRIRKDYGDIKGLSESINKLGQLQPIVVDLKYNIIAGERRYKAIKELGLTKIDAKIMEFEDYLHILEVEIAENEARKEFTVSERVAYAEKIREFESLKAKQRQMSGLKNQGVVGANLPQREKGRTRDKVAEKAGFSSPKQYEKAKFVVENGSDEIKEKMDSEKISVHKAYTETKGIKKEESNVESKATTSNDKQKDNDSSINTDNTDEKKYDDFVIKIADSIQNLTEPFRKNLESSFQTLKLSEYIKIGTLTPEQQHSIEGILDIFSLNTIVFDDVIEFAKVNASKEIGDEFIKYLFEISVYEQLGDYTTEYLKFKKSITQGIYNSITSCDDTDSILSKIKSAQNEILMYIAAHKVKNEKKNPLSNSNKSVNINSYKVLGIPEDASSSTVKERYRKLSKLFHPDIAKSQGIEGTEYLFQLVKEAYNSISQE